MHGDGSRAVQVVERGERPYFVASGFLLAPGLAITAAHAVRGAGPYEVRAAGERAPVRRVVPAGDRDVALLVLEEARTGAEPAPEGRAFGAGPVAEGAAASGPRPVRFAELPPGVGQVAVHGVGFPRFTLEDGVPRGHQFDGTVQLGSDRSRHQIQLALTSSDPPPGRPGHSPWEGCSGAGVRTVYEGLLAGVVTSHRPDGDRRGLTGTALTGLTDAGFLAVLAEHGVEAEPLPARPVARPASAEAHWLPEAVRQVLARRREEAAELPYRFREDRRARRLTDVYVRQVLSPGPSDDAERPDGPEPPAGAAPADAPSLSRHPDPGVPLTPDPGPPPLFAPPRPLRQILADLIPATTAHLLIEAPPGAGKTTLLHMCGLELADAALTAPTGRDALVPLWVTAPRLAASGHSLESAIAEAAGLDTLPPLPPGARWLVLIDALDEVHHDHRSRLIHRLADRARQGGASGGPCLLLTTRPDPDAVPQLAEAGFRRYVLDPFDRRRLEEFAHGWFEDSGHGERAAGFLEQVDEAGLGELLGVPLLATAAAIVHEDRPEAPLPDNSWDLYDRFRLHLRAVKRDQARRLWADLEERAAPTPDGTWAVTHLRERADELLGEVAYAQVAEGETDLPGVAARWWAGFADPPLDGWNAVLTEALLTTGLFVRRRQGLEFLHTTFAEHCAAQRLARRLPARFDPADPLWRTTLLAASGITGHPLAALHRKALLHHARRAPGGALLDWSQGGSFDGHRLAAELMAERYPADDAHHRRFLAALRERGADADELLLRLRHPLVTEHLRELLRSGTPAERLLAARGLARSDGETVARELPGIAESHGVGLSDVYGVAQFLEEEWPRQTAEAVAAVLRRPGGMPWDRIGGAARLEDEELRAELLRAELRGLKGGPAAFTRITAARTLAELGEPYEGEAVEWLVWTALDPLSDPLGTTAMAVAGTLSTLGAGRHREAAVQALRRYVVRGTGSPLSASYLRGRAASRLLRAGEPYAAEAVTLMREHASDREYRGWAAQELNGREPGSGPARGSVEEALDSATRAAEAWWRGEPVVEDTPYDVRETLAAHGAAAVPVLMDSLCAPGSMGGYGSFSPDVMAALGELHEAFPEETAGELRARFAYGGPGDDLYDYGSRYPRLRQAVLGALLALGVLQPPGDSPLLLRLAEEGWSWEYRTAATDALRGAAPAHKRDLADELCRTLTRLDRSYVRDAAETLVRIGGGQARRVGTALRTRAQSPDPAVRRGALQGLLALGGEWVPTDAAPLAELAACRQASPAERLRAIRASALLEGRLPRRTAGALYDVVEATGDVGAYFSLAPLVSRGLFPAGLPVRRARRMLRRNVVRMHLFWPGLLPRISRDVPAAELARAVRARIRGVVPGGKRRRLDLAKLLIALGDERSAAVAARVLRRLLVGERSWSVKRREIAELLVLSDDSHARRLPTRIGRGPLFWRTPVRDWGEDTLTAIASGGGQWARWAADTLCAMVVENPGRYGVERRLSVLVGLRWTFRPQVLTALRAVAATDSPAAPQAAEALALLAARD